MRNSVREVGGGRGAMCGVKRKNKANNKRRAQRRADIGCHEAPQGGPPGEVSTSWVRARGPRLRVMK